MCLLLSKMRYVDLFCGMGSFSYSFHKYGFECVMACDIDACARQNFQGNFGTTPVGDIKLIDAHSVPEHNVLCAGFPCQPFSHAGQHNGFLDIRGTLFFDVMRIVTVRRPSLIVLENVPALKTHDGGATFSTITTALEREGYHVCHTIANCKDYGLPQSRRRLFIVASKEGPPEKILDFARFERRVTLSEFFARSFDRDFAFTIRCGGRRSGIHDRHNWDAYMVDNCLYHLTTADALRLQGFDEYTMHGSDCQQWKLLGNTIPTIFTHMIAANIVEWGKKNLKHKTSL